MYTIFYLVLVGISLLLLPLQNTTDYGLKQQKLLPVLESGSPKKGGQQVSRFGFSWDLSPGFAEGHLFTGASLEAQLVKNLPTIGRPGFNPWVRKVPWRKERLPTPVFWPGEFHGAYSPWGHKESDTTFSLSPHVAFARVCAFLLPLCVQIPLVIRTAVILD